MITFKEKLPNFYLVIMNAGRFSLMTKNRSELGNILIFVFGFFEV